MLLAAVGLYGEPWGRCSNWCTFATWASRQAGQTIRGEDLLDEAPSASSARDVRAAHPVASLWRRSFRRGVFQPRHPSRAVDRGVHSPFDAFELASDAVARGNRKVFGEIGLEFARYLQECAPDLRPDSADLEQFLGGLRAGAPPDGPALPAKAFTALPEQRFEPEPKRGAELIAAGESGDRAARADAAERAIREALDAAWTTEEELGCHLLPALFPRVARRGRWLARPATALLGRLGSRLQREVTDVSRAVITRCFMVLMLPGTVLALGRTSTRPALRSCAYSKNAELEQLVARYEQEPPAIDDYGAPRLVRARSSACTTSAHLFRCISRARRARRSPPFTPEQVERFRAGIVPDGDL